MILGQEIQSSLVFLHEVTALKPQTCNQVSWELMIKICEP